MKPNLPACVTSSPPSTPFKKLVSAFSMTNKNFKSKSRRIQESYKNCRRPVANLRFSDTTRGQNLELLRIALQPSINRELRRMWRDFHELFVMAFDNIDENISSDDGASPEEFLFSAVKQGLDDIKRSYSNSMLGVAAARKKKTAKLNFDTKEPSNTNLIIQRVGPKWDVNRLTPHTLFILGPRANKALGLGTTRGRLYIKHPEIFKYPADQEDKQWLAEKGLMNSAGGKVYILIYQDIFELVNTVEYKNMPGVDPDLLKGFLVTDITLHKIKSHMIAMINESQNTSGSIYDMVH